ncbi:hypothetical protein [Qipengyuania citrea]|uniref:hypothetical protein n=1 Tax=Qipengyuania citrea TaxID=225971 RepID=UPI0032986201
MTPSDLIADYDAHEPSARTKADWLAKQAAAASTYASVEHVATEDDQVGDAKWRRSFSHHLRFTRAGIARTFMRRDCFVSLSVIDDLIFQAVKAGRPDIVAEVVNTIVGHQLHDPGMIVFPLHGFGITRPFADTVRSGPHPQLLLGAAGLCVMAQTNDIEKTIALLDDARAMMGIAHDFDAPGILSYTVGNRLSWLHSNPIVAFRFNSYSHNPYENQLFYQLRMRRRIVLVTSKSNRTYSTI